MREREKLEREREREGRNAMLLIQQIRSIKR